MKKPQTPEARETHEMLRVIAEKANIEPRQMYLLWDIITGEMAEHLALHFRSVDFGFAVLHACPYRHNWKNYVIQRLPFLGQWIRGKSIAERDRIIRESGLLSELQETYMLAVRQGRVYVTLEILPKKSWWRYALAVQNRLLAAAGPVGYCRGIGKIVGRLKERMIEAYLSHLHQISTPCARLWKGRYYGNATVLTEYRERKKVRPSSLPVRIGQLYVPNSPSEFLSTHTETDLEKSDANLLPMSNFSAQRDDVRQINMERDGG